MAVVGMIASQEVKKDRTDRTSSTVSFGSMPSIA